MSGSMLREKHHTEHQQEQKVNIRYIYALYLCSSMVFECCSRDDASRGTA